MTPWKLHQIKDMDGRDKPGHDEQGESANCAAPTGLSSHQKITRPLS
jgi:hypothetical protein